MAKIFSIFVMAFTGVIICKGEVLTTLPQPLFHSVVNSLKVVDMIQEKKCSVCLESKPFNEYYKDITHKDGVQSGCKICFNKKIQTKARTKEGLISKIYYGQRHNSRVRGHNPPDYTRKELKEWLLNQQLYHELYYNWKASNYNVNLVPSCDRMDNSRGYSLNRLQLVTWAENKQNGHNDMRNGKLLHGNKPQKPVVQFDLDGNFIAKYHSMIDAKRQTGIDNGHISKVCLGERKTAGKFKWKLERDFR